MGNYSPIDKLFIKDFRNLKEVVIDFSKSPIIALVGGNDAGKTSVVKAFGTCALNLEPRRQAQRIRHGTPMFGVALALKDGTIIKRLKSKTANRYDIVYPNGEKWDTNKISEGTPVQVKELMGIVEEEETKQLLQLRTYEDQLLFVYTPGSTNYKVMYDALKVGQLTRAIKNGTEEANAYQKIAGDNYLKRNALINSLQEIKVLDIEDLVKTKEAVEKLTESLKRIGEAVEIKKKIDDIRKELGTLQLIDTYKLGEIHEITCRYLNESYNIRRKIVELSNYKNSVAEVDTLNGIEEAVLNKFSSTIEYSKNLQYNKEEYMKISSAESIDEISTAEEPHFRLALGALEHIKSYKDKMGALQSVENVEYIENVGTVQALVERTYGLINSVAKASNEKRITSERIGEINRYMKEKNVGLEICPKCGEEIVVDYNKYNYALEG